MNSKRTQRAIRVLAVASIAASIFTGGAIVKAMQSFNYAEEEIHEVMSILLSLKDQVVLN
jgi:hypothetical protein